MRRAVLSVFLCVCVPISIYGSYVATTPVRAQFYRTDGQHEGYTTGGTNSDLVYKTAGISILALEFIGLPLLDRKIFFNTRIKYKNPFEHIGEPEGYLEDKLWHFTGASATTEMHYHIFADLIGIEEPRVLSAVMSLIFWTGLECLDGMTGSYFSFQDETANTMGTLFGLLKLYDPDIPLEMRVGVKDWGGVAKIARRELDKEYILYNYYGILFSEIVYTTPYHLYAGIALSTTRGDGKKDQFGMTVGYDLVKKLNDGSDEWWSKALMFASKHFSLALGFTWWKVK